MTPPLDNKNCKYSTKL